MLDKNSTPKDKLVIEKRLGVYNTFPQLQNGYYASYATNDRKALEDLFLKIRDLDFEGIEHNSYNGKEVLYMYGSDETMKKMIDKVQLLEREVTSRLASSFYTQDYSMSNEKNRFNSYYAAKKVFEKELKSSEILFNTKKFFDRVQIQINNEDVQKSHLAFENDEFIEWSLIYSSSDLNDIIRAIDRHELVDHQIQIGTFVDSWRNY